MSDVPEALFVCGHNAGRWGSRWGDACPIFSGKRYLDRELTDPAGKGVDDVRPVRDDIDRRVRALLAELVPAAR